MDVRFVKPYYYRGELFTWLANTGHWPDIGGSVPGGFSANATEIEQEGLRLPPVKLFKCGELDREIYAIITSNIRVADQAHRGCACSSCGVSYKVPRRLSQLLDRYGRDTVEQAIIELKQRASAQNAR